MAENPFPDPHKPTEKMRATAGDVFYLMLRSKQHQELPLKALRWWWEPPLHLGQVWVFNFDGFPRAAVSFASLSEDAQRRYVETRAPLKPEDWRSGDIPWIIDWLSPYENLKMEAHISRWICESGFPDRPFRYMRMATEKRPQRIVETFRNDIGKQKFRILRPEEVVAG